MLVAVVAAGCLAIGWLQGKALWLKRKRKEFFVFSAMMAAAAVLAVMQAAQVTLPNPLDWLSAIFKPVGLAINSVFT